MSDYSNDCIYNSLRDYENECDGIINDDEHPMEFTFIKNKSHKKQNVCSMPKSVDEMTIEDVKKLEKEIKKMEEDMRKEFPYMYHK